MEIQLQELTSILVSLAAYYVICAILAVGTSIILEDAVPRDSFIWGAHIRYRHLAFGFLVAFFVCFCASVGTSAALTHLYR